jgi:hypothetical protein
MNDPVKENCQVFSYWRLRSRWPRKAVCLGVVSLPILYVSAYLLLRLCGVFYPFYDQGGWEIDGTTHVSILDVAFLPAKVTECMIQNRSRWLKEPTGG